MTPREGMLGGVLLRYCDADGQDRMGFVDADVVLRISPLSSFRRVPGLRPPAAGIALADGEVVTVLELDRPIDVAPSSYRGPIDWVVPGTDRALVCDLGGQRLAISGGVILATGVFEASPDVEGAILWRGARVSPLDVRSLYRSAEAAIWSGRASERRRLGGRESTRPPRTPESG